MTCDFTNNGKHTRYRNARSRMGDSVNPDHAIKVVMSRVGVLFSSSIHGLPGGIDLTPTETPRTSSEPSEPELTLVWIVCHAFPDTRGKSILGRRG